MPHPCHRVAVHPGQVAQAAAQARAILRRVHQHSIMDQITRPAVARFHIARAVLGVRVQDVAELRAVCVDLFKLRLIAIPATGE